MPTKDVYNPETGETDTVEMQGDELARFEELRAIPDPEPRPTTADLLEGVAADLETATTPKQQAAAVRKLAAALRGASR